MRSTEPLFILSCYRTGSTLLRYIFDTHPDVYSPPEIGLGDAAFQLAHLEMGLLGKQLDRPEQIPPEVLAGIRGFLGGRLEAATARKGKLRWCEKTPTNLAPMNLGLLRLLFPEAGLVCLHRHAFDVVRSLVKMIYNAPYLRSFLALHKGNERVAALDYWNERTKTLLSLEAEAPERCVRLRYEDLVARPAEILPPIFARLGLALDERLLASVFTSQHDHGMEDHYVVFSQSIHAASVGSGRDLPLDGIPAEILDTTRQLLEILGYPEKPRPVETSSSTAAGAEERTARWLFETYLTEKARREPAALGAIEVSYRFTVHGEGGGTWVIDPRQGRILSGATPAACSIEVSAPDLLAIASGRLHPMKAAEQGQLRVQGDARMRDLETLTRFLFVSAG